MSYTELLNDANGGSLSAMSALAKLFFYGRECEHSYERAFEYSRRAWEGGCTEAADILFQCYLYGFGTEQNVALAKEIAVRASKTDAYAAPLGVYYLTGIDCDIDVDAALSCLARAAEAGSEYALETLTRMYLLGYRAYKDYEKAAGYIDKLYAINSPVAYAYDGYRYIMGTGVQKDPERGVELSRKAYEAGVLQGFTCLYYAMHYGIGTEKDTEGAVRLVREAERRGSANAALRMYNLNRYNTIYTAKYARTNAGFEIPSSIYLAAKRGDSVCEYIVWHHMEEGDEKIQQLERAARHGHSDALGLIRSHYVETVEKGTVFDYRDMDRAIELCNIGIKLCVSSAYYFQSLNYSALKNGAEEDRYLLLGIEAKNATCAYEYAKKAYCVWQNAAQILNPKLTAHQRCEAARLFLKAIEYGSSNGYSFALSTFEYLPEEEKAAGSELLYKHFISLTNVDRYTKEGDIYTYSPMLGGKRELCAYFGNDKKLVIPEGVDVIGKDAFCPHAPVEHIVFPKSLKKIEGSAFGGMVYLRTVELQSAAEIGECAFSNCKRLSEIKLSTGMIVDCAFMDCTSLKSVHIPEGTKTVLRDAFLGCTSLEEVSLPESLEVAGACVFDGCDKLPLTEWGGVAYLACGNNPHAWAYKIVSPPERLVYHPDTKIITTQTSLEDKEYSFDNVKEIEIPSSVSWISYGCLNYRGVAKLTLPPLETVTGELIAGEYSEIILPVGTKFLDRRSIIYTGNGSCHVWLPEGVKKVEHSAFVGTGITVHAPEGTKLVKKIFTTASKKNPNEIVYYAPGAKIGGTGETSTAVSDEPRPKVLLLDDGTAITSDGKTLGKNGEVIADSGKGTAQGKSQTGMGGSGTGTQSSASGTKKGTTGTQKSSSGAQKAKGGGEKTASSGTGSSSANWDIPKTVTPKPRAAASAKPKAPEAPKNPDFAMDGTTLVKYSGNGGYVEIPEGVREIGSYAFDGRFDVHGVGIPESVLFIATRAFSGCTGMYSLTLPRTLKHIASDAFLGCRNLKIQVCKSTTCDKNAFRGLKLFAVKKYK